jgi:hypothetical protein
MNTIFKSAIRASLLMLCLKVSLTSADASSTVLYGNFGTINTTTTSNTVGYLSSGQANQF